MDFALLSGMVALFRLMRQGTWPAFIPCKRLPERNRVTEPAMPLEAGCRPGVLLLGGDANSRFVGGVDAGGALVDVRTTPANSRAQPRASASRAGFPHVAHDRSPVRCECPDHRAPGSRKRRCALGENGCASARGCVRPHGPRRERPGVRHPVCSRAWRQRHRRPGRVSAPPSRPRSISSGSRQTT